MATLRLLFMLRLPVLGDGHRFSIFPRLTFDFLRVQYCNSFECKTLENRNTFSKNISKSHFKLSSMVRALFSSGGRAARLPRSAGRFPMAGGVSGLALDPAKIDCGHEHGVQEHRLKPSPETSAGTAFQTSARKLSQL